MTFASKYWEWKAKREKRQQFKKYCQLIYVPYSAKKKRVRRYRKLIDILTDIEFLLIGLCLVIEVVKIFGGWYCD